LGLLVRSRALWAILLTQACGAYTLYLFAAWLPRYFELTRGTDILKSSGLTAVPYVAAAIAVLVTGWISDRYLGNAVARGQRRSMVAVMMLIASVVVAIPYASSLTGILVIISISLAAVASGLSLNMTLAADLLKRSEASATLAGFTFTGGNIAGIIAPIVTGYIVAATGRFDAAFAIAGVLLALGAVISFALTRGSIGEETVGEMVSEAAAVRSGG
jgi:ACS family glucarate transporter-like MFS transporter